MTVDANSTSPARSRAGLALAAIALIVVFGMAGQSVLVRLGASATLVDGFYWALGIAIAAALAVGAGMRPGSSVSPLFGGLAIATDTVSAAFFLALAGAIFAWGHDGLAFAIGLGAGCLLLQLVVAPRLAGSGAHSLSGYFAARYPGRVTGALCALTIVVSMLLLLMAELMAAGLVGARLLDIDFGTAAGIAACAVLACFIVRGLSGAAWVNGVLFPIMLVAILVPLVVLSARWYDLPVPEFAYANALWQVQGLEEKLIEQDLADPAVMRPMLTAFLAFTPVNFLGVVLGLAAGVAALPSMLPAQLATASARHARHAALWGLGAVVLLLTLMPAVAAYAKLSFIQLLADRTPIADLPGWMFVYGKLGLVEICGRAATSAAAAADACAALPETAQGLRLQDIALSPDMIMLALPDMGGLDRFVLGLLAAAALAVAIATANGPLGAIVRALGHDSPPNPAGGEGRNSRLASYAIAALAVAAATAAAFVRPLSLLDAAAYAFVIAAAGLFPALFAALWWRRANTYGAAAAIFAGLAVAAVYLVGARYFAAPFYEWTAALSNAGSDGFASFTDLKDVWIAAAAGADKEAAWAALQAQARDNANWWGVDGLAVALLALPVGFVALIVVSLITPAPRPAETAP